MGNEGLALKYDYITVVPSAGAGHIPVFTADGKLADGGVSVTTAVRSQQSASDTYIPTELAVATALANAAVTWIE